MSDNIAKKIVNIHAKVFNNSSFKMLVKEKDTKTDAAGVAGSQ